MGIVKEERKPQYILSNKLLRYFLVLKTFGRYFLVVLKKPEKKEYILYDCAYMKGYMEKLNKCIFVILLLSTCQLMLFLIFFHNLHIHCLVNGSSVFRSASQETENVMTLWWIKEKDFPIQKTAKNKWKIVLNKVAFFVVPPSYIWIRE